MVLARPLLFYIFLKALLHWVTLVIVEETRAFIVHFILTNTEDSELLKNSFHDLSCGRKRSFCLFQIWSDHFVTLLYKHRFLRERCLHQAFLLDYLWRLVMGNAAAGGLQPETAENSAGTASGMGDPTQFLQKKQPAPPKLPMPPEDELDERFKLVLVSNVNIIFMFFTSILILSATTLSSIYWSNSWIIKENQHARISFLFHQHSCPPFPALRD